MLFQEETVQIATQHKSITDEKVSFIPGEIIFLTAVLNLSYN